MSNVKISSLPSYTGNTSGSWLVMNNSGETTTYKVQRETLLSGFQPSGNYATTGSNVFRGNQTITGSVNVTGSLEVTGSVNFRSNTSTTNYFESGNNSYLFLQNHSTSSKNTSILSSGSLYSFVGVRSSPNDGLTLQSTSGSGVRFTDSSNNVLQDIFTIDSNISASNPSVEFKRNVEITGSLNVSGNISATTGAFATSITYYDSFVGAGGLGNLSVPNGYVNTPLIFAQSAPPLTGTLDIYTFTRLSLTSSIGNVNISAGEFGGSPRNINLTSAGGTINSGSLRIIGNTTITGSLVASGSLHRIIGTTEISGTLKIQQGSTLFASNIQSNPPSTSLQLFSRDGNIDLYPRITSPGIVNAIGSLHQQDYSGGDLFVASGSAVFRKGASITGSVNISEVINLAKQNPLPTGTTGSLAVSGSGLYFHNGTSWNLIS